MLWRPEAVSRYNGFDRPFHVLQVVSWIALSITACLFYLALMPCAVHEPSEAIAYVHIAVYTLSGVVMVLAAYHATSVNPADPVSRRARGEKLMRGTQIDVRRRHQSDVSRRVVNFALPLASSSPLPAFLPRQPVEGVWCSFCGEWVTEESKHCRACDKCVHEFDHHCRWLNTCIGGYNYRSFIVCVSATAVLLCHQLGVTIALLVRSYDDEGEANVRRGMRDAYGLDSAPSLELVRALLYTSLVVTAPFCAGIVHLLGLHIWLRANKLTTYAWILRTRDAKIMKLNSRAAVARRARRADGASHTSQDPSTKPTEDDKDDVEVVVRHENHDDDSDRPPTLALPGALNDASGT